MWAVPIFAGRFVYNLVTLIQSVGATLWFGITPQRQALGRRSQGRGTGRRPLTRRPSPPR